MTTQLLSTELTNLIQESKRKHNDLRQVCALPLLTNIFLNSDVIIETAFANFILRQQRSHLRSLRLSVLPMKHNLLLVGFEPRLAVIVRIFTYTMIQNYPRRSTSSTRL